MSSPVLYPETDSSSSSSFTSEVPTPDDISPAEKKLAAQEYQLKRAKENKMDPELLRFLGLQFKPPPPRPQSPETLRKLGAYKTKPIVSYDKGEEAGDWVGKVTYENFQIKCKTIMDYACYRNVNLPKKDRDSRQIEADDPDENVESIALNPPVLSEDERLFRMYFRHLNRDMTHDAGEGTSRNASTSEADDSNTSSRNVSSCSKSTSSRNGDSIDKSSTGSNGYYSQQSSNYSNQVAASNGRPAGQGRSLKRKRNQRQFHDYFNGNRKDIRLYSLIRHSFSSEYDLEYLKTSKAKQELQQAFDLCRNQTRRIIPETEEIVTGKVLLISQHTIKQARKSANRKYRPPSHRDNKNVPFEPYLFRTGLDPLRDTCEDMDKLFIATENGPYQKVYCGKDIGNASKRILDINQFDHEYITSNLTMPSLLAFIEECKKKDPIRQQFMRFLNSMELPLSKKPKDPSIETEIITDLSFMEDTYQHQLARYNNSLKSKTRRAGILNNVMMAARVETLIHVNNSKIPEPWAEGLSPLERGKELIRRYPVNWNMPSFQLLYDEYKGRNPGSIDREILSISAPFNDEFCHVWRLKNHFWDYSQDLLNSELGQNHDNLGWLVEYCKQLASKPREEKSEFEKGLRFILEYYLSTSFTQNELLEASELYHAEKVARVANQRHVGLQVRPESLVESTPVAEEC